MSLRAASPPPRATTPEPTLQPLPSPRLRTSRSFKQLTAVSSSSLSSHEDFHLTFDEFGTDSRESFLKFLEHSNLTVSFSRTFESAHISWPAKEEIRSNLSISAQPYSSPSQTSTETWFSSTTTSSPSYTSSATPTFTVLPCFDFDISIGIFNL